MTEIARDRADGQTSAGPPFPEAEGRRFEPAAFEARLRGLATRTAYDLPDAAVPEDFARSSVLLAFWRSGGTLRVLLTRRAASLRGHPGQMSFPGGRLEEGEDPVTAALRETREEVGIPAPAVEVLGRLDEAWSGARHRLVPVVGWLEEPPAMEPNPSEVASIHTPAVDALLAPAAHRRRVVHLADEAFHDDRLRWADAEVTGLSADLLIEAIRWGLGGDARRGPERLRSLRAFLRSRAGGPE